MQHLRRVLCGVGSSVPGRAAFDHALALCRRHASELTVVHVIPRHQPLRWNVRRHRHALAGLEQAAREAGVPLSLRIQPGNVADVVLLHARAWPADLIVIGADRRTGLRRFQKHSIGDGVVRGTRCPVLVTRSPERGGEMRDVFRHILCAFGSGPASHAALERALVLAENGDARLTLMHVLPDSIRQASSPLGSTSGMSYFERRLAEDIWQELCGSLPDGLQDRIDLCIAAGTPAREVVRTAAAIEADLIVIGAAAGGALTSSRATGLQILDATPCPVLVIPGTSHVLTDRERRRAA